MLIKAVLSRYTIYSWVFGDPIGETLKIHGIVELCTSDNLSALALRLLCACSVLALCLLCASVKTAEQAQSKCRASTEQAQSKRRQIV